MEAAQRIKATTLLVIVHSVVLWWISGLRSVSGHGRLIEPPSRSSMWRYGYDTEPNYQDNQLYCGGFTVIFYIIFSIYFSWSEKSVCRQ